MPLDDFEPLQSPLATQDVGELVALQLMFELLPEVIEIGLELILTTGFGGKLTVTGTFVA